MAEKGSPSAKKKHSIFSNIDELVGINIDVPIRKPIAPESEVLDLSRKSKPCSQSPLPKPVPATTVHHPNPVFGNFYSRGPLMDPAALFRQMMSGLAVQERIANGNLACPSSTMSLGPVPESAMACYRPDLELAHFTGRNHICPAEEFFMNPLFHGGHSVMASMEIPSKLKAPSSTGSNLSSYQPGQLQLPAQPPSGLTTMAARSSLGSIRMGPQSTPRQAPRFQCPDCNRSYSTFSGLSKHRQFHCASQLKKQFACKFCQKQYGSLGALKMHIRTHTLPCKCQVCGKAFSRPWLLQGHLRTHTGEKPFRCGHCGRAFADRSNLRAHLQTHSEIKKYRCKTCQKTFSRMSLLNKHENNGCPGLLL